MEIVRLVLIAFFFTFIISCAREIAPPTPVLPIPSNHQLEWQEKEMCAFVHFTVNTFTGKEWGYGDENPEIFNPVNLNTNQWAEVLKNAGFKGAILTAKHHDGFCLWPSQYTDHSVRSSGWRNGKGDVVRDFMDACKLQDLEFGIYLSPWDRNHKDYGSSAYIGYYRNQLSELLTQYGPFFEVWFDGANGGDGFYGGACETRKIDDQVYYNWPDVFSMVRNSNPSTLIFGDARVSTDARWCGNERGFVGETNWNKISPDTLRMYGKEFKDRAALLNKGDEDGLLWMPAEVDVSIRPGWFYHASEDSLVKTSEELFEIYLSSVGRGANLLLSVAPNRDGIIPEPDVQSLLLWKQKIDEAFSNNLALNAKIYVDNYRGNSKVYAAENLNDEDKETYWATDDEITSGTIECDFGIQRNIEFVLLQEYIKLGQRVKSFSIEIEKNGEWILVSEGTTIGYKRIVRLKPLQTQKLRININGAKACPVISNLEIY